MESKQEFDRNESKCEQLQMWSPRLHRCFCNRAERVTACHLCWSMQRSFYIVRGRLSMLSGTAFVDSFVLCSMLAGGHAGYLLESNGR